MNDFAIDYYIGDIIVASNPNAKQHLCLVTDFTEKGAIVNFIDTPEIEFLIPNHELHLMKKHKLGNILYGKKR